MWPWEHFAIGYVAVSLLLRVTSRPLTSELFAVLAVATQFPDIIDKPLAWAFNVLPSGTTLAHSIFLAVPLSAVIIAVSRYYRNSVFGVVFTVGYLLHLPGDVLYGTVTTGRPPVFGAILWPLFSPPPSAADPSFVTKVLYFIEKYRRFLTGSEVISYVLFEVVLLGTALLLWRSDGYPGVSFLYNRNHAE